MADDDDGGDDRIIPFPDIKGLGEWEADDVLPSPRAWLLGNSFCRCFLSSLIGDGGVGKTAVRYLQALAMATGRPLTGEHVFQRCRVLIVSLEDDADELRRRIMAACLHYNIRRAELAGWLYLAAPGGDAGKLLTINRQGSLEVGVLTAQLEAVIRKRRIDVVMLDPFVKAHSIQENDNSAMDRAVQLLSDMGARHNISIDIPHHVSKGLAEPGNAQRGRGSSSFVDALRLAYTLSPMSSDEAKMFSIPDDQRRSFIRLDKAKLNLARMTGSAQWFKLVSVRLGNGTEHYPNGDEVQTVETWLPPETWGGLSEEVLNSILDAIEQGLPDGSRYSAGPNAAASRAAWQVVTKVAPHKSEQQAREIVRTWLASGLLVEIAYRNPATRKEAKGLRVDGTKRPGTLL
ncbi:AAA family ATPase [Bradyrhizobium neotropicale]|uniref:AAA family ATPase n=1 Tax=Bradyrhizobium neotropicale TaxID=1497615 RepID=UPI001AD6E93F|nr:AAA family ATPase [Bradyrhizobium neotropicale]MBO4221992.1 AAA family ATPase [Bradyrhizobium neotropicale]